jgi:ribosomal-protein-alanine N-acetyltransferase
MEEFRRMPYETERLILKVLDKSYANLVLDYYIRNAEFLKEWEAVKADDFILYNITRRI